MPIYCRPLRFRMANETADSMALMSDFLPPGRLPKLRVLLGAEGPNTGAYKRARVLGIQYQDLAGGSHCASPSAPAAMARLRDSIAWRR
jgi:hypothetical protein